MNIKIILTIIATIIAIIGFIPYLRDVFKLKTKPHLYTWLIWLITQGTGISAIWYGGGGWGALNLTIGIIFVFFVFLFSLKFGTKNITRIDTFILVVAFLAIIVWWQLNQPLLSILMVSLIDFAGYIPSFRKTYKEPWSETLSTWALFVLSNIFAILALSQYNLFTLSYLVSITVANSILFFVSFLRRSVIPKPNIPQ